MQHISINAGSAPQDKPHTGIAGSAPQDKPHTGIAGFIVALDNNLSMLLEAVSRVKKRTDSVRVSNPCLVTSEISPDPSLCDIERVLVSFCKRTADLTAELHQISDEIRL